MPTHIQIGDITPRIQYNGDGAQTRFDFPFPIFNETDLEVYIDDALQSSGFSIFEVNESDGGYIIFDTAPTVDELITLRRQIAIARTSDFQESGELRANVLNDELDYQIAALQQVADEVTRSLRLNPTDVQASLELPSSDLRAGNFLAFDNDGDLVATAPPVGGEIVSNFMATLLDDTDAATAQTTLGLAIGNDVLAPDGDGSALTGIMAAAELVGQCYLSVSGANLSLAPKNGNKTIDGAGSVLTISDTPVTLAYGAAANNTWYYIYGSATGSTIDAMEFSATVPVTAANGVQHKTADTGSVLLGWAYSGTAWATDFTYSLFNESEPPEIIVQDEKSSGTDGGTSVTGWNDRVLNTVKKNTIFNSSLTSNRVTLPVGKYNTNGTAVAYAGNNSNQTAIYNATDAAYEQLGTTQYASSYSTNSTVKGSFEITSTAKAIGLRQWMQVGVSANGLGQKKTGGSVNEVYARMQIRERI